MKDSTNDFTDSTAGNVSSNAFGGDSLSARTSLNIFTDSTLQEYTGTWV